MKFLLVLLAVALADEAVRHAGEKQPMSDEDRFARMCQHLSSKNEDIEEASCVTFLRTASDDCAQSATGDTDMDVLKAQRSCVRSRMIDEFNLNKENIRIGADQPNHRRHFEKKRMMKERAQKKQRAKQEKRDARQPDPRSNSLKKLDKARQKIADLRTPNQFFKGGKKRAANPEVLEKKAAQKLKAEKAGKTMRKPGPHSEQKKAKLEEFKAARKEQLALKKQARLDKNKKE